jgi:hypothetical protein
VQRLEPPHRLRLRLRRLGLVDLALGDADGLLILLLTLGLSLVDLAPGSDGRSVLAFGLPRPPAVQGLEVVLAKNERDGGGLEVVHALRGVTVDDGGRRLGNAEGEIQRR